VQCGAWVAAARLWIVEGVVKLMAVRRFACHAAALAGRLKILIAYGFNRHPLIVHSCDSLHPDDDFKLASSEKIRLQHFPEMNFICSHSI